MNKLFDNKLSLNDMPNYSPWPKRLLGLEKWKKKIKTKQEIIREFEYEKWGTLLNKVKNLHKKITMKDTDRFFLKNERCLLSSRNGDFEYLSTIEAHKKYVNLVEKSIKKYLPMSSLVELGAGYGSIILTLAKRKIFSNSSIFAGEYTKSGLELIKYLSKNENIKATAGFCDFTSKRIINFKIPENAIIFTSYGLIYIPHLSEKFFLSILKLKPKVVFHFEPCYEHCNPNTLLGLMRQKYIKINGYNTNLVTLIYRLQKKGFIKVVQENSAVFGINPFFSASIIAWKPDGSSRVSQ